MSFEQPSMETPESATEQALTEYEAQMQAALADHVIERASTGAPEEARQAFMDSLVISRAFDNVIGDTQNVLDIASVQEVVDERIQRLGLDPTKFSLERLKELIDSSEAK